ncbi:MAG: hypothetical protein A2599_01240 [Candidatus Staskawiczbacteria bacterium RIFOXYD1_FULL_39_28]|uniref:Thioredoxin-like fold domain-containing protein n=1 Tax=Candidatus Staskawiczbacteria bacterium RIFOXYC1_FULL_38_18 TaxID=1802229 RepID=A0A1G2JH16_9BACT|nr:MAG: hypothetical protein A2401_02250 [Candidatus Staskawiczbacteria bacterium RIFOXYC1_FULL_38_18]OGZ92389.1 MAG: hypothetical protein A2599_01240 [Candidatus Staskawiczbacteria bacterium RIFOXYD1_FULL_39_28]
MSRINNLFKKMDKNTIMSAIAVVGVVVAGALIYVNSNPNFAFSSVLGFGSSGQKIAQKSVDYINNKGLSQTPATLSGTASSEYGLIKFKIKIGDQEFDSYATKDGKFLFPQAIDISGNEADGGANNQNATAPTSKTPEEAAAAIRKTDKPMLEAYVVSRCPFGLQMQRVMANALAGAPDLGKYMKVMYMGSVSSDGKNITAMHGEAEATENLRQICIREEQPAKYWSYVSCQMKSAGTEVSCEKSTGVDSAKLSACLSDPKRGVAFAKVDFDLNTKYNVTGSPTLILNGESVSEFDFGGRTPEALKSVICAAFNTKPGFCSTKLDTNQSPTSFSLTIAGTSSGSTGNSGANGTNCAPAQ